MYVGYAQREEATYIYVCIYVLCVRERLCLMMATTTLPPSLTPHTSPHPETNPRRDLQGCGTNGLVGEQSGTW